MEGNELLMLLLHPKWLLFLGLITLITLVSAGSGVSWFLIWIPFYVHDALAIAALIGWLRKSYTRPWFDRVMYTGLVVTKLWLDVSIPLKLDGHTSISYIAAFVPLPVTLAIAFSLLYTWMRKSTNHSSRRRSAGRPRRYGTPPPVE
ncbi:uncharacterized protein MONBRDRAFT_6303 [Monosiga brevicollis MX1]|uniref:Uncharacterized protein n=1 Tax=Monosiga brevicollis TaxID=81824 RepID=A9UTF5_MONBE|nr:uncharacterized protein MONBRDRAFT_6303 [Monosiga brevicollis MX1]EDQ91238.1 predicted protein [Monosiga brevicollis MX1]|eukprot:XP_001743660.1 hypothetical protein [Monosiga brevicollis MX1]